MNLTLNGINRNLQQNFKAIDYDVIKEENGNLTIPAKGVEPGSVIEPGGDILLIDFMKLYPGKFLRYEPSQYLYDLDDYTKPRYEIRDTLRNEDVSLTEPKYVIDINSMRKSKPFLEHVKGLMTGWFDRIIDHNEEQIKSLTEENKTLSKNKAQVLKTLTELGTSKS